MDNVNKTNISKLCIKIITNTYMVLVNIDFTKIKDFVIFGGCIIRYIDFICLIKLFVYIKI